jgi:DNA-binding response OmpR family regulator
MHGTILIYGNEPMLVATCGLILEKAGYQVFPATKFASALLALVNERINVLLLCQSLSEEDRRSILETARAIRSEIKCVTFGYDGREVDLDGQMVFERLDGPALLVKTIGRIVHNDPSSSDLA